MGPLLGHGAGRGDGPRARGARGAGAAGVPRCAAARRRRRPARRGRRAGRAERRRHRRPARAPTAATPRSASWTPSAPRTSAPPTGTTACRPTATSLDALDTPPAREAGGAGHRRRRRGRPEHGRTSPGGTGEWRLLAEQVDLHELADGGHYFLRTRPAEPRPGRAAVPPNSRRLPPGDHRTDRSKGHRHVVLPLRRPRSTVLRAAPQAAAAAGRGHRRPGRLGRGAPGRAARHRRSSTARSWSAGSACVTRPRWARSSAGWPAPA